MSGKRFSVFLSMSGCKRRCVYCDQRAITGEVPPSPERIMEDITSSGVKFEEICFFGGSFTCLPVAIQDSYLKIARDLSIPTRMSTHPMCIDEETLLRLSSYPISMIELGISSLDDKILEQCRRGYTGEEALRSMKLILDHRYELCAQLMIGLPGQTCRSSIEDLHRLAELKGPRSMTLRIYPCLVLEGTRLHEMMEEGYSPLSLDEAVSWGGKMLQEAHRMGFHVQRIGLSETPSLALAVRGGPHHPALGEMIRGYSMAQTLIRQSRLGPWQIPANRISYLTGHGELGLKTLAKEADLSVQETKKRIFVCPTVVD
ncbi:MAG: radical SAM protein [Dethiosulfovibrio sp.]|nr:radical SAM protein [Dethiosulfovibrio sp.]